MHSLLAHNRFVSIPSATKGASPAPQEELATVLANFAYYGFAPAADALSALKALDSSLLAQFWTELEPHLKEVTGTDRGMEKFVVYKNFPGEVLAKNDAEYWSAQILMYLGLPAELFAEEVAERAPLNENLKLTVLALASGDTLRLIHAALVRSSSQWTPLQFTHAEFLHNELKIDAVNVADFGFKLNALNLAAIAFKAGGSVTIRNATDVLRFAAALSQSDTSLRGKVQFAKWSRASRKALLTILEGADNLEEDMSTRPELWKKLLKTLHPGDYKCFPKVLAAYASLYSGKLTTFDSSVEALLRVRDVTVLSVLNVKPGMFARRLHHLYSLFGMRAVDAFIPLMPALNATQLLKLKGYLSTINGRKTLIYAPNGRWTKAQFADNTKVAFDDAALAKLLAGITATLQLHLGAEFTEGVSIPAEAAQIKLQTNSQELAPYGRGTAFDVPDDVQFIRTASYWASGDGNTVWFDNSWNFYGESWEPRGSCCWNTHGAEVCNQGAVFSGDPINSSELKGRACQMIDLNLDKLAASGVRYAVWSILSYNGLPFSAADEVLATLQWGVDPEAGALYEPGRAQMVFPLKGDNRVKYIAYLDIAKRKLVYLDANLYGGLHSAECNEQLMSERMPALVEYLDSLPSVQDYLAAAPVGERVITVEDCLSGRIG